MNSFIHTRRSKLRAQQQNNSNGDGNGSNEALGGSGCNEALAISGSNQTLDGIGSEGLDGNGSPGASPAPSKRRCISTRRSKSPQGRGPNAYKQPPRGKKIAIKPEGDGQFSYCDYEPKSGMKVGPMLGVLVRREYPSTVVLRNPNGAPTKRRRIAKNWDDYYEKKPTEENTAAERVKDEFWCIYEMKLEERQEHQHEHEQEMDIMQEADRILDNYAAKAVKTMMYHARLDAVKRYYKKHKGEKIADAIARPIQLEFEQYNLVKPANFSTTEGWRLLSQYWCSAEYKKNREAGQAARLKSQDVAQNRGGSRPFAEFQQYLGAKYGEDKAGAINTYSCMKVGQKNISSSGTCGPINSQKAQKRIDDYCQAAQVEYPDDWQQRPLDGKIVYNTTGGLPHGRLAIGYGALKKADVIAAAKGSNIRPSNSLAHQNVLRENQQLVQRNTVIAQRYETETIANREMLLALYEKFQMEVPLGVTPLTGLCHLQEQATGSSRVDSQSSDRTPSTHDADPTLTTDDADE